MPGRSLSCLRTERGRYLSAEGLPSERFPFWELYIASRVDQNAIPLETGNRMRFLIQSPLYHMLMTMLDAVYVDTVEERRIVAIRPKPAFRPLFEIATTRAGSGIVLVSEKDPENADQPPPGGYGTEAESCSWWRRGRVELPV